MATDKTGKQFEKLIFEIYKHLSEGVPTAKVTINENIVGSDGAHQFDVLIRHSVAGIDFLTILECKDYKGVINISVVDAFISKIADVKANKGILASRKGFSKNARKKAERHGVDLVMVDSVKSIQIDLVREIPVVVRALRPLGLAIAGTFVVDMPEIRLDLDFKVNGIPAMIILLDGLKRGIVERNMDSNFNPEDFSLSVDLRKFFLGSDAKIDTVNGEGYVLPESARLLFKLEEFYMACFTKDLNAAVGLI